ncbi:flavin reductase family protein [Aspergillus undulatus]|uniref:flavin reductase family protein n=1 Tax=Aspergillus undulatus TaxID=1810928 RepID=UPI003CCCE46C
MNSFTATATAKASYKVIQDVNNFAETEASRTPFNHNAPINVTKPPYPNWTYGHGVPDGTDPSQISTTKSTPIAPRPIGLVSTISSLDSNSNDEKKGVKENLAPFSYFQLVDHDPPLFILGFSSRPGCEKDTFHNLKETGECVINSVSEDMIEAVNATFIDAPYDLSEWDISGLTKKPSATVRPARVAESVFCVEGKALEIMEFGAHSEGMSIGGVVLVKASRFWVKEGVVDDELSHIELEKLRPVAQLGGISYGRITEVFERPRMRWDGEVKKSEVLRGLEGRREGKGDESI